jgi:hypothetical protein
MRAAATIKRAAPAPSPQADFEQKLKRCRRNGRFLQIVAALQRQKRP